MMTDSSGKTVWQRGLIFLILTFLLCIPVLTSAENTAAEEKRELTITVVEDGEEILEIQDRAVPLAAFPGAEPQAVPRNGERHVFLMGAALLAVIAYVWYFSRYEKRLFRLRREAAEAEHRFLEQRRRERENLR